MKKQKLSNRERIMIHLLTHSVVRRGQCSWKWEEKAADNPSLNDNDTSALFRADMVEEKDDEMVLTITGRIVAGRLIKP